MWDCVWECGGSGLGHPVGLVRKEGFSKAKQSLDLSPGLAELSLGSVQWIKASSRDGGCLARRELGSGRTTRQPWASPSHCRGPGQQCPVVVVHTGPPPLAGHDSLPTYTCLHQPHFLIPGWALLHFCLGPGTLYQPWGSVSLPLTPVCLSGCLPLPLTRRRVNLSQ